MFECKSSSSFFVARSVGVPKRQTAECVQLSATTEKQTEKKESTGFFIYLVTYVTGYWLGISYTCTALRPPTSQLL